MSKGNRVALRLAKEKGEILVEVLKPFCEKIIIAGSVRREKPVVNDLEIVALAREHLSQDLFGERVDVGRTYVDDALENLEQVIDQIGWRLDHRLQGKKLKRLRHVHVGLHCDLFIVTDQRSWGAHVAVRTGPYPFSIEMMKKAGTLGMFFADGFLLHNHRHHGLKGKKKYCRDGAACNLIIPLPTESQVFQVLKMDFLSPKEREEKYGIG